MEESNIVLAKLIVALYYNSIPALYFHEKGAELGLYSNYWPSHAVHHKMKNGSGMDILFELKKLTQFEPTAAPTEEEQQQQEQPQSGSSCDPNSDSHQYLDCVKDWAVEQYIERGRNHCGSGIVVFLRTLLVAMTLFPDV